MRTHRRLAATLLATLAVAAACEEPPSPAETPDAGQAPPPACDLGPHQEAIELSEGSRATLSFTPTEGGVVRLAEAPTGWLRKEVGAGRFVLKPPLGSAGTHRVSFEVTCGETARTSEIAVTVRKLRWSSPVTWTPKQNGPAAREHAALFFDEANADHLYVFGGYLFEPRQYTISSDLWRLDFATGTWTELQAQGDIPLRAGGRVAPIPGARAILFSGGDRPDQSIPHCRRQARPRDAHLDLARCLVASR